MNGAKLICNADNSKKKFAFCKKMSNVHPYKNN